MRIAILMSLLGVISCGDSATVQTPDAPPAPMPDAPEAPLGDILDELRAIPGLTVTEQSTMLDGYRFFVMEYDQPVDHDAPSGARFQQRMTLLHRDYSAPVVVYNSGYFVSTRSSRSQLAVITSANQLSMEYRFFEPSRPDPADWTKLDIWQAATDQHRITEALKARIYKGKWLTTGASKGGMTSLFHRRFYPADVDGTVALVAPFDYPDDAVQSPTNRYIDFIENVGTDPACRQKLKDFQNTAIERRDAMKTRMLQKASYTSPLDGDHALEFAVEELPFIFWQYGDQSNCSKIPASSATDDAVFKFLDDTIDVTSYGDDELAAYLPYYHQSATQLGYPTDDESYLVGLMYPGQDTAQAYIPAGVTTPAYDGGAAMRDVQNWIATSGSQILLVYGQNDPWSAGAVDLGAAMDSYKYISPNGNHGSSIGTLGTDDRSAAITTVMRWAGMAAHGHIDFDVTERTAEQDEQTARHRL